MGLETEHRASSPNPLTWLLVGAGDISQKRVAPAIASGGGRRLAGICDSSLERARALAARFGGAEVYTDLEEALERSSAQAVYVATPVFLHSRQAAQVLASGRHVLVEKPLGVSTADASLALRAGASTNLRAGCAYYRRLSARYRHAKQMLEAGEFGRVVSVRMSYASWFAPEPSEAKFWRVVRDQSGGGPLADMGSHMFDILIGLFGRAEVVAARTANVVHRYQVEDSAAVFLEVGGGIPVFVNCHWCSRTWVHEFEIIGSEARLKWDPFDSGPVLKTVGSQTESLDLPPAPNVHTPLLDDFELAVRLGRDPAVPLREAYQTNVLLDAAYGLAPNASEVLP
jgi:predicted dehydrogenase